MKKMTIILTTLATTFLMTGCTSIKGYVYNKIAEESGVMQDANYREYVSYKETGQLDADGLYCERADEFPVTEHEPIHVTFSNNEGLDARYYSDSALSSPIDVTSCYVSPGKSIYATVAVSDDFRSNLYSFSGFRVNEYDAKGKRHQISSVAITKNENSYILTIPANFTGSEISIEPVGAYSQRTVTLNDYYLDDNNQVHDLAGRWTVNKETYTSNNVTISPVVPYIISYEYDSNEYFYVSSSPECHYINNLEGVVIFKERAPDDETVDYKVELHKYLTVTLVSDTRRSVMINGEKAKIVNANAELPIKHIKYGDRIILTTNIEWPGLKYNKDLSLISYEELSYGEHRYKYELLVPEKGGEFKFDPSKYQYEHGEITFKYLGEPVNSTQLLSKGRVIYYEQASADYGYWLAGSTEDHQIIIGDKATTEVALRAIHFTPKVEVRVSLPQPKVGGVVEYKLNGEPVSDTSITTYSGSVISMSFTPWEGWMRSGNAEDSYKVQEGYTSQAVIFSSGDVETLFEEDVDHKPVLSVNLEKSVGESMQIGVEASHFDKQVVKYGGGWHIGSLFNDISSYNLRTDTQTVISNKKIGTDQPVRITMAGRAIPSGQAVRIVVEKTDSKSNKTIETFYANDLSKIEPIYIYPEGKNASSRTWYSSIDITIGVVDIEKFVTVQPSPNTIIEVKNASSNRIYAIRDFIEASQEITVTISPVEGFYVTGKKVSGDIYSETMDYTEYKRKMPEIIASHPAVKYLLITLDSSDPYASYSYTLDVTPVNGTVSVKEGQTLKLSYVITDSGYRLSTSALFDRFSNPHLAEESLIITSSMDGKTITKEDFNIKTERVG